MVYIKTTLLALLSLVFCTQALAEGDPQQGREAAFTCTGCHSSPGYRNAYPVYTVPKIGGQQADYLETALSAYRSGERAHDTMHAQIAQMTNQQIADIAAYFSSLRKE